MFVWPQEHIYPNTEQYSPVFGHRRLKFVLAMDESFRVRIDKVFGSLASSSASAAPVSSLWCLAEDEIDNNQRSGEKEISKSEQENEVEDLSVNEEKGKCSELQKPSDYDDEEWEIKNSIGMDSTLDMEVFISNLFMLY